MSYDPQSPQPGGEIPPEDAAGQPVTPPPGDYTPPPPEPVVPPEGGYAPPPGGYTPPPGGYTPPPGGGYTPPPGGGYTPPPSGGYTPPPPPPAPTRPTGGATFGNVNQAELQGLMQRFMNVITHPSAATYESEIPNASWRPVIIGIVSVFVVSFLVAIIRGLYSAAASAMYSGNAGLSYVSSGAIGVGGAFLSIISVPLGFFLGALVLFGVARILGGRGSTGDFGKDFLTHSYLLALSWTPLKIIATVLLLIPVIGGFLQWIPYLYQIYNAGLAIQASQKLAPGRAQLAAWLPTLVGVVFACLCAVLALATGAALLGGALSSGR